MWDALWTLYDGNPNDGAGSKAAASASPSKHRVAGTKTGIRSPGGGRVTADAIMGRGGHNNAAGNRTPTLQTSLHSTSSNGSNSKRQSNAPTEADSTAILRGIIVGEEQSGKTSLIRRLRGEDPFTTQNHTPASPQNQNQLRRSPRNLMALIPWKLPQEAPFHQSHHHHHLSADPEESVQLYVSEGKSFCYSNKEKSSKKQWISMLQSHRGGKECDFVVWMIDPRMDKVLEFLREGLDILFPPTEPARNGKKDKASGQAARIPLIQHLCILLNFRDLSPTQQNDNKTPLVDVQHAVEQVMARYPDGSDHSPSILVYESSMKHCYGLQNLHSFITIPYLSYKEQEFRRRAEHARKQHFQWKQGLVEARVVQYSDFVQQILEKPKAPETKQSLERRKLEKEKEQLERRLKEQNQFLQSKAERREATERNGNTGTQQKRDTIAPAAVPPPPPPASASAPPDQPKEEGGKQEEEPDTLSEKVSQRRVFAKSHRLPPLTKTAPRPSEVTEHNNLDSFFSDDEDDEQAETEENNAGDDSSDSTDENDSDDEGDFYIDVSGTRCAHANMRPLKHTHKHTQLSKSAPDTDKVFQRGEIVDDIKSKDEKAQSTPSETKKSTPFPVIDQETKQAEERNKTDYEKRGALSENKNDIDVKVSNENIANASTEVSSSVEDGEEEAEVNETKSDVPKSPLSENAEISEVEGSADKTSSDEVAESDSRADAHARANGTTSREEFDDQSLNKVEKRDADPNFVEKADTIDEVADTECAQNNDLSGARDTGASLDEPKSKQTPKNDDSSASSDPKPEAVVNKGEESDGKLCEKSVMGSDNELSEGVATDEEGGEQFISTNAAETDKKEHQVLSNGTSQHQVVMDSDDESTDMRKMDVGHNYGNSDMESKVDNKEQETHEPFAAPQQAHKHPPTKSLMQKQPSSSSGAATSTPVSSAALAAIEAAKREAEQMMAQSQSGTPATKREKKSKKKKDGDKKKKKKKDKKQKD